MDFHAGDGLKPELGCKQHSTAHAGSEIDKAGARDRRGRSGALPAFDKRKEDRGGDSVVGSGMAVVGMAAFQVAAGDKAAGSYTEFRVEGVLRVAIPDGKAGEFAYGSWFVWAGRLIGWRLHGLNGST